MYGLVLVFNWLIFPYLQEMKCWNGMVACCKENRRKKFQILLPNQNICHRSSSKYPGRFFREEQVTALQLKVCPNFRGTYHTSPCSITYILINNACFICFQPQRVHWVSAISNRPTDAPDPLDYYKLNLKEKNTIIINPSVFSGLYDLRKDKPYVMVTSPGSPEHLASNTARILRASKSVTGPNSLYVGGKIQVIICN